MIANGFWHCFSIFLLQWWHSSQTVSQSLLTHVFDHSDYIWKPEHFSYAFPFLTYRYHIDILSLFFFHWFSQFFTFVLFTLCFKMHLWQINTSPVMFTTPHAHVTKYEILKCTKPKCAKEKAKALSESVKNKDMVMGLRSRGVVLGLSSLCLDLWKLYAVVRGKRSLQCAVFNRPFSMSALSFSAALVKKRDGMCFWKSYNYHGVISPFNIRLSFVQHVQKA